MRATFTSPALRLAVGGFSSPSTDPARHTRTHYSISVIRCSDFTFRYIRRLSSCRPMGAFIISPLPHLDERSAHRSGPFPPGAFGCTPINSVGSEEAHLRAGLRPPLKLDVQFSRIQLSPRCAFGAD